MMSRRMWRGTISRNIREGNSMKRIIRNQRGQTATEYILIISVIVLGLIGAASFLLPTMNDGIKSLSDTLESRFNNNPTTQCDASSGQQCE